MRQLPFNSEKAANDYKTHFLKRFAKTNPGEVAQIEVVKDVKVDYWYVRIQEGKKA